MLSRFRSLLAQWTLMIASDVSFCMPTNMRVLRWLGVIMKPRHVVVLSFHRLQYSRNIHDCTLMYILLS